MNIETKVVTRKMLKHFKAKYYACGKELKVGDKIIPGFIQMSPNMRGIPLVPMYECDTKALAMYNFVYDENTKSIYQLYSTK